MRTYLEHLLLLDREHKHSRGSWPDNAAGQPKSRGLGSSQSRAPRNRTQPKSDGESDRIPVGAREREHFVIAAEMGHSTGRRR